MPPTRYSWCPAARNRSATGSSSRNTGPNRSGITAASVLGLVAAAPPPTNRDTSPDIRRGRPVAIGVQTVSVCRVRQAIATPSARAELRSWPLDESIGHLVMADVSMVPTSDQVDGWLTAAYTAPSPVVAVRTGALYPRGGRRVRRARVRRHRPPRAARTRTARRIAAAEAIPHRTADLRRARRRDLDDDGLDRPVRVSAGWRNDGRFARRHRRRDTLISEPTGHASQISSLVRVGFAITGKAGTTGYLQRIAVHPECQRLGIGRQLVDDALEWLMRRGTSRALVNTGVDNLAALADVRARVVRATRRRARRPRAPPDTMKRGQSRPPPSPSRLLGIATTVAAQNDPEPAEPSSTDDGSVRIELIDQSFDLTPGGSIELKYRLLGDLETSSTSTRHTTPTSTTTISVDSGRTTTTGCHRPARQPEPTTSPPTTAPPLPADRADTAHSQLPRHSTIQPTHRAARRRPEDRPPATGHRRVDLFDIRSMITVESPNAAVLEVSVPTDTAPSIAENLEFNVDGVHPIVVQLRADDQVVARHGTVVERRSGTALTPPTVDLSLFAAIDDPGPSGTEAEYTAAVTEFAGLVVDAEALDAAITMAVPPSVVTAAVASGAVDPDDPNFLADDVLLAAPRLPSTSRQPSPSNESMPSSANSERAKTTSLRRSAKCRCATYGRRRRS